MTDRLFPLVFLALFLGLAACGGGGGGSSAPPVAVAPPPSGGNTGGAGGGGGTVTESPAAVGLVPGGAGVRVDTGRVGVQLDVAVGGTGAWMGDIQAFSSVVLNDITVDTAGATFRVEDAPASQSDLKQGQQVLLIGNAQNITATEVHYRANVKGPVTSVNITNAADGAAVIAVLGQRVITGAGTTFVNGDLEQIAAGQLAEVSGVIAANGDIEATFVERKATLAEFKVMGRVAGLSGSTFTLGGLTVNFGSATLRDFPNNSVTSGEFVEVKGAPADFTAPATFRVSSVERLPVLQIGRDAVLRLEGSINRFTSATAFDVQGIPVTTDASTQYRNGTVSSLALGVNVQIEGQGNGSGATLASRITIQPTSAIRAEGNISAINTTTRTLTILGVPYRVRELTRLEDKSRAGIDPMTFANFNIGDEVEVRGYLDGATVVATRIERRDEEQRARLRAIITATSAANLQVALSGSVVQGRDGVTVYRNASGNSISATEFFNVVRVGSLVRATWDRFNATSDPVDEFEIETL